MTHETGKAAARRRLITITSEWVNGVKLPVTENNTRWWTNGVGFTSSKTTEKETA